MMTILARLVLGCLLLLTTLGPAWADVPAGRPSPSPGKAASDRSSVYSPRVRRTTQNYLRLRLLELRELDLDRARAVIEHRLRLKDLLDGEPGKQEYRRERNKPAIAAYK